MARRQAPTDKQLIAIDYLNRGDTPTKAMKKAGYAPSSYRNPKKNLLEKAGTKTIVQLMQGQLIDSGVDGIYLADKLAEFTKSSNPKVFFGAYDRVAKILGIDAQENGQKKREITFTEWVANDKPATPLEEIHQEDNLDDLIALDNIKVDRFGDAYVEPIPQVVNEDENNLYLGEQDKLKEIVY